MSGGILASTDLISKEQMANYGKAFARSVGCEGNSVELVQCLRNLDPDKLEIDNMVCNVYCLVSQAVMCRYRYDDMHAVERERGHCCTAFHLAFTIRAYQQKFSLSLVWFLFIDVYRKSWSNIFLQSIC